MTSTGLRFSSHRHASGGVVFVLTTVLALVGSMQLVNAQGAKKAPAGGLEGSWSGGGTVSFASGARERARCRAHYRRAGTSSYVVNATCATASGSAAQTATIRQVGANRYSGSFYNSQYSISGVMHVVVRGASQRVQLISDGGSALINLSR